MKSVLCRARALSFLVAAAGLSALCAASGALAGDLGLADVATPVPGIDATYRFRETATPADETDSFRVRIDGDAITKALQEREHRFIAAENPKWTATVKLKTQNRAPNNIDTIDLTISKQQHLVVPAGHPEVGAGDVALGKIAQFNAAAGNIVSARFQNETVLHGQGKGPHRDTHEAFYTQAVDPKSCFPCRDIDSWRLTVRGVHSVKPPSKFSKEKDISVSEEISKSKVVIVSINAVLQADKVTEAQVFGSVTNNSNTLDTGQVQVGEGGESLITDSVNGGSGITVLNQDVGVMVNQGLLFAVGELAQLNETPDGSVGLADGQAALEQSNANNVINAPILGGGLDGETGGDTVVASLAVLYAAIDGSINQNVGVTAVNNSAAVMQNQTHALAMAVSLVPGVALSDADLEQAISENASPTVDGARSASALGSMNGNPGITVVNNSAGMLGNQASVISFVGHAGL